MTTSYINGVNRLIASEVAGIPGVVLYGENVNVGSHISGLTRQLIPGEGGRVMNVGNCELTHCGVGFGLMLGGATAILFAKQLDFMLLGVDQFVSSYNFVRAARDADRLGSFTVISIVCDQGLQGPQSSFNALGDLCSLARVSGYTLTNGADAKQVLGYVLRRPGFRFVCLSQRLFGEEIAEPVILYAAPDLSVFQYTDGADATIVCFNFSLPEGSALAGRLAGRGLAASLFSANYVPSSNWERIKANVQRTRRLVIIDDSKGVSPMSYLLADRARSACPGCQIVTVMRDDHVEPGVCHDKFEIDFDAVVSRLVSFAEIVR